MKKYYALGRCYARCIIHGFRNYKQVPDYLKEVVKEILIENGHEDLIVE